VTDERRHYWQAALDGEVSERVSAHLAGCESCAEIVQRVQRAAIELQASIPQPPPGLDVKVLAAIEQERQAGGERGPARRRSGLARVPWLSLRLPAFSLTVVAVLVAVIAVISRSPPRRPELVPITQLSTDCTGGGRLVVAGTWSGTEAKQFAKVLGLFQERTGIQVVYAYETRNIATAIQSLIKSGCVPNVALLPQPGTMADLARQGALVPLSGIAGDLAARNYSPSWRRLGEVDGTLYGVWFKAAEKSLIWYRPAAFRAAGITHPPRTWAELLTDAELLRNVGIQPFAIGGADGWTLTDWFENVYLSTAGLGDYQALAENRIKWTAPSVKAALRQLAEVFGDQTLIGPTSSALRTTFEQSVSEVFGPHPRAAMVFEGDFVRSFLPAKLPASQAKFFAFPQLHQTASPPIEVGGDVAVLLDDTSAGRQLIRFLATPAAGQIWAHAGGFVSPNRDVPLRSYPDAISRLLAARVANAPIVGFGISDQEPPAFGSDPGQGMWAMFQQFLAHPDDIDRLTRHLEAGATAVVRCERAVRGGC
jgi:alpha-glucoside transport system substrate-binding protein